MNYSTAMVSQYFPTFYSNGTQKRLAQYSQGFQDFVHKMFGRYCTEIERERYRRGKRSQLPCDIPKDERRSPKWYKQKNCEPIFNVLKHHKNLTVKEIHLLTEIPSSSISSILIHAIHRGEITKDYIPSKSRRRDVCIYNLVENNNE